jgi:hypothetical protein
MRRGPAHGGTGRSVQVRAWLAAERLKDLLEADMIRIG